MRALNALAKDIVESLPAADIADAFSIPLCDDMKEPLVDWLSVESNATLGSIADCLGRGLARKLLRTVGIDVDRSASSEALVEEWVRHREEHMLIPAARPQELAGMLSELAAQIRTTPDKFDFVDVLVMRCTLLLRYIALYHQLAESIEPLSFEELCALVTPLADEALKEILAALPQRAGDTPEHERTQRSKVLADGILTLLDEWHFQPVQTVIPKGAVVDEFVVTSRGRRATCYDEFRLRITISGLRTTMEDGDNVLLASTHDENVTAPRLRPLPRNDAWTTPGRATCGLAARSNPTPRRRIGNRVFMSYCHKDAVWAERVRIHLKPLQDKKLIDLWDDQRIRTGDAWEEKIEMALKTSGVAILVVSPDFLASDYISRQELPALLKAVREENAKVIPLYVRPVMAMINAEMTARQSINGPEEPLEGLSQVKQDQFLNKLAGEIAAICDPRNRRL